jgi:hypothetical protein
MGKTQQQEREIELLHQLTDNHKQTERELERVRWFFFLENDEH